FRRVEVDKLFEAVIAVDDTAIEVVKVARRKTATGQLHHRTEIRRDYRKDCDSQATWLDTSSVDAFEHLESFVQLALALAFGVFSFFGQLRDQLPQIDFIEQLL